MENNITRKILLDTINKYKYRPRCGFTFTCGNCNKEIHQNFLTPIGKKYWCWKCFVEYHIKEEGMK